MKKILLTIVGFALSANVAAQTTLFEDGFESYPDFVIDFSPWINLDLDGLPTYVATTPSTWDNAGDPKAFQVFNFSTSNETNATSGAEVRNFDPHDGLKYAACWGSVPADPILANNDWLISPPIALGASGNSLSFWVKSLSNSYGLEKYKVGVYVGSGTPTASTDFTLISSPATLTAPYPNWAEKIFALDAYNGQTVRIGIQCVSADVYMFMVDDFKVTTTALATEEVLLKNTRVYPNPSKGEYLIKTTKKIESVEVFDASGKLVLTDKVEKVDITKQPKGVYLMKITFDDGQTVDRKLIKE